MNPSPGQGLSTNAVLDGSRRPLRIRLDLPAPAAAVAPVDRARRKTKSFSFHNVTIPYAEYRSQGRRYWMLFYYQDGHRERESRSDFGELKKRAEEIAVGIANGQTARLQLSERDWAWYLRIRELEQQGGASAESLMAEAIEARRKQAEQTFKAKNCPDIVAELLETKRKDGKAGKKWLRILELMLNRFAAYYTGPLHLLRASDLNTWLRGLPGGLVYRRHHRRAALQLAHFATAAGYIPRDWEEFKLVDDPEPPPVKIRVWSPEQLVKMLAHTLPNMIPFTALQSFAGIRHEELNPEECEADKLPLDWRDVDFSEKLIHVTEDTGKTGARIVPMTDNLIAWLKPYAKASGPICKVSNTDGALRRAKIRAGLPHGKNESRNILRKSFGSYRLAVVKHIGQVADEMGNSPAKIKSNYRKPRPESEGKRWFGIFPTHADVLQLPLGLR